MTAFPRRGKAERTTPRRKASVAVCGRRPYREDNDTPALNALTALRGAPTSMGRGETPVELLPAAADEKPISFLFRSKKGELSL